MRKFLLYVSGLMGMMSVACEEPIPHVLFEDGDSTQIINQVYVRSDDYDGKIPGLDAQVIDYTLPNPYQHKPQLFADSTIATSWDDAGFPNAKNFIIFFKNFQLDLKDRNKDRIVNLIKFPLRDFSNRQAFMKNFDSIFAPDFVTEVLDQDPMEIYRDKKGAMIGDDGQLWFRQINGQYRIIEVNP